MTAAPSIERAPARALPFGGELRQDLPERPPISAPPELLGRDVLEAERARHAVQPRLGLAGLALVVPVALAVAFGAGGPEPSVLVVGPLVTFALPVVAMIAFWWEDWPGSSLRPGWSGLADTVLIAVAAVVLTLLGQSVVGDLDLRGIFDPTPGSGHSPTFPATLPLAGAAFVAMLQLTLVCEGWPLRRLGRLKAGALALLVAWVIALIAYLTLVDFHPPPGSGLAERDGPLSNGQAGALLVLTGAWQAWLFIAWRGWPFSGIRRRWLRLASANAVIAAGAVASYVIAHGPLDARNGAISAAAGSFVAAGLVVAMLFEDSIGSRLPVAAARAVGLAAILAGAAALDGALTAYADSLNWTRATPDEWVGHAGLNAIGVAVILHVAIGRRWPFAYSREPSP